MINQFNGTGEVSAWHFDYGSANVVTSVAFSTKDAKSSATSGSMAIQVTYGPSFQQAAFTANLPTPVDATTMTLMTDSRSPSITTKLTKLKRRTR